MDLHLFPAMWTGLEIAQLAADVATPVALAVFGIWAARLTKRVEHRHWLEQQAIAQRQWVDQKIIEKRLAVFDYMGPRLNDLYCFFSFVGHWKDISPPDAIQRKRELDRCFYINRMLFSDQFSADYFAFIRLYFVMGSGRNHDAKLKTTVDSDLGNRKEAFGERWDEAWVEKHFARNATIPTFDDIKTGYDAILASFARELIESRSSPGTALAAA